MEYINAARRIVDGKIVETLVADAVSANILEIEIGTNGYKGGDSGHGGRTFFRLKNEACTDISIHKIDDDEVTIELGGDTELATFIECLEFALKTLKEQTKKNESGISYEV